MPHNVYIVPFALVCAEDIDSTKPMLDIVSAASKEEAVEKAMVHLDKLLNAEHYQNPEVEFTEIIREGGYVGNNTCVVGEPFHSPELTLKN
jgi:hypothetical protein